MGSNEEYLDGLLKSILNDENSEETVADEEEKIVESDDSNAKTEQLINSDLMEQSELDLEDLLAVDSSVEEESLLADINFPELSEIEEAQPVMSAEEEEEAAEAVSEEADFFQENSGEVDLSDLGFDMAIEESYEDDAAEQPMVIEASEEESEEEPAEQEESDIGFDMAIEEPYEDDTAEQPMIIEESEEEPDEESVEEPIGEGESDIGFDMAIEEPSVEETEEMLPPIEETDADLEEMTNLMSSQNGNEDEELAEISGLINHSKEDMAGEDEDMLAFLESMTEPGEKQSIWGNEDGDAVEQPETLKDPLEETVIEEAVPEKKKKGLFGKLFGGNKKGKQEEQETENALEQSESGNEGDLMDETAQDGEVDEEAVELDLNAEAELDELLDIRSVDDKPKKQNFITKIIAFLTSTDEDEEDQPDGELGVATSEENKNILEELEEEDKNKKKKKVKKGKGKDEGDTDGGPKENAAKAESARKKKEKQDLKAQKRAEKREKDAEEARRHPNRPISKKNIGIIAAISVTIGAVSIMITLVIPSFLDKGTAREAFYNSDFSTSYILLYGKNLDESDALIFNKSKIIMEMNRKLDSYHSYSSMEKPLEALDALLSGVSRYEKIAAEAEANNVSGEVRAIYDTILSILNDKYGISEAVAKEIYAFTDDLAYTRKLNSIVFGTPYVDPAEEQMTAEQAGKTQEQAPDTAPAVENAGDAAPAPEVPAPAEGEAAPVTEGNPDDTQTDLSAEDQAAADQAAADQAAADQAAADQAAAESQGGSKGEQIQGITQPIKVTINQ